MKPAAKPDNLIPLHGGYRKLKSFQVAQLIYDVTVRFCDRYVEKRSRTHDQMVQAARSGVQNIAEGSQASGTSKKTELKLTNVARASLEELRLDYEDFLRQRALALWPPNHLALMRFKARRCATLEEVRAWVEEELKRARANTDSLRRPPGTAVQVREGQCQSVSSAELVANAVLSLLNLASYFLDRQLAAQAAAFEKEGGFTERLYRVRRQKRAGLGGRAMKPWPKVRLGEVLRHRNEFITIDDLTNYRRPRVQLHVQGVVLRDEVPGALIKTKTQQVCGTGEFLVAEIDAKVGGFGIVPESLDGSIVSSHYFLFVIDEAKLDRRFLDFFIRTPAFREQVAAQGSTNYAAIRPAHVLGYEIPLPPLAEQQRVVARIEELAAQIQEARTLRHQAAEEAEALLTTARRATISQSNAESVLLEDACAAIIDNLHSNPRLSETGLPCIRSPDVGFGTLDLEGAQRTDEVEFKRRTIRGEPREGDIVLVREGGGTGKCAVVERGQKFSLGQRVMMLRPNAERILPRFLLHQLLSPQIQEEQIAPLSKGSASPHLNIGALRKFSLLLPPLAEQHRIVAALEALEAQVAALKRLQAESTDELDALLPAILDRAFKGEL